MENPEDNANEKPRIVQREGHPSVTPRDPIVWKWVCWSPQLGSPEKAKNKKKNTKNTCFLWKKKPKRKIREATKKTKEHPSVDWLATPDQPSQPSQASLASQPSQGRRSCFVVFFCLSDVVCLLFFIEKQKCFCLFRFFRFFVDPSWGAADPFPTQ